jgi:prepilin-type N-terminal cleavage/methylation domain-containing protein/prepilin-type processing-associated H-X9-DG protein
MPGQVGRPCRGLKPRDGWTLVELIVVIAIVAILLSLLLPAVQKVREAANRARCLDNLRQVGLAAHGYHGVMGSFPPGLETKKGKAAYLYLSWLARLLPYVEQTSLWETTVDAFRQEPLPFVDPPHVGLSTVVRLYGCPSDARTATVQTVNNGRAALTSYLGVEGTDLSSGDGVLYANSLVRLSDVTDGTSGTLMAGERPASPDSYYGWWYAGVGRDGTGSCDMVLGVRERNTAGALFHGCPVGPYAFSPGRLTDHCDQFHFWSPHPGGAHFLFCDGSARFLPYSADAVLPALATRAGGEAAQAP